jgi:hypothetical protein
MREIRTSGSVGAPGGQPPGATRWAQNRGFGRVGEHSRLTVSGPRLRS